jgi:hypothetical protein
MPTLERFAPARWSLATRGGAIRSTPLPPQGLVESKWREPRNGTGSLRQRRAGEFRGQAREISAGKRLANQVRIDAAHEFHVTDPVGENKP